MSGRESEKRGTTPAPNPSQSSSTGLLEPLKLPYLPALQMHDNSSEKEDEEIFKEIKDRGLKLKNRIELFIKKTDLVAKDTYATLQKFQKRQAQIQNEIDKLLTRLAEVQKELAHLIRVGEGISKDCDKLKGKMNSISTILSEMKKNVDDAERTVAFISILSRSDLFSTNLPEDKAAGNDPNNGLLSKLDEAVAELISNFKITIQENAPAHISEVAAKKQEIKELSSQIDALSQELSKIEEIIASYETKNGYEDGIETQNPGILVEFVPGVCPTLDEIVAQKDEELKVSQQKISELEKLVAYLKRNSLLPEVQGDSAGVIVTQEEQEVVANYGEQATPPQFGVNLEGDEGPLAPTQGNDEGTSGEATPSSSINEEVSSESSVGEGRPNSRLCNKCGHRFSPRAFIKHSQKCSGTQTGGRKRSFEGSDDGDDRKSKKIGTTWGSKSDQLDGNIVVSIGLESLQKEKEKRGDK